MTWTATAVCVIALVLLCGSLATGKGEEGVSAVRLAVVLPEAEVETTSAPAVRYDAAEAIVPAQEPEGAQEDFENEKIEEAILEQNYLYDEIPLDYDTQACLRAWCEQYSVPYSLALGVIEAESSFQPDASNGSCYGYMQINSINREWLGEQIGVTDLKDPLQNLHSGVFMLSDLYGKYEDWSKVLICYNCGEKGAYDNYFSQGLTSSRYSRRVLELQNKWAEAVGE